MSKGQLYLVSAPSGAGKTSLVRELLKRDSTIKLSISHTTREPRVGEQDEIDYYFVSHSRFEDLITKDAFLEHANVYGNHYGTCKQSVFKMLDNGADVILEIDWQGAKQVMAQHKDTVHISIAPPSIEALRSRLTARGQDDAATIECRMLQATEEIVHLKEAKYTVINDDFSESVLILHAIFIAERQKYERQKAKIEKLLY